MTEPTECGVTWGHAMHIHPGGYCPGVWITGGLDNQPKDSDQ